ncbi:hypothetical protein K7711_16245 [Nocardia sp. CA2R105]|uniref:hypothetical protein n=1 Tax=Nocardia coffeae TaxID=2873381 RepID=UPI001CA5F93C|nr:hypothetical protein [Nocardia coffeae]MBY8858037.1 hypothetical protein [Nocardia coffeae]
MDPWTDGETDPGEQMLAELLAAYGPDWPTRLTQNVRFDPNAEPIEFAPPDTDAIVVRKVFLRLALAEAEQFKRLGRKSGRTPSELVSTWIAARLRTEPDTDTVPDEADPQQ